MKLKCGCVLCIVCCFSSHRPNSNFNRKSCRNKVRNQKYKILRHHRFQEQVYVEYVNNFYSARQEIASRPADAKMKCFYLFFLFISCQTNRNGGDEIEQIALNREYGWMRNKYTTHLPKPIFIDITLPTRICASVVCGCGYGYHIYSIDDMHCAIIIAVKCVIVSGERRWRRCRINEK